MPTNRRKRTRSERTRVTETAVAAWRARDYDTVERELGLKPWECSPSWCLAFRNGGGTCTDEVHGSCQRGQLFREELEGRK